jgi:hypothetical protein
VISRGMIWMALAALAAAGCESDSGAPDAGDRVDAGDSTGVDSGSDTSDAHRPSDAANGDEDASDPSDAATEDGDVSDAQAPDADTCEGEPLAVDAVPLNVLILADRSGRMHCHVDGSSNAIGHDDPASRWQVMLGALEQALDDHSAAARFGLAVFPGTLTSGGAPNPAFCGQSYECEVEAFCEVGDRVVEISGGGASAIPTALNTLDPGGCAPIGPSLVVHTGYAELAHENALNTILLITDGEEHCSQSPNQASAAGALLAQNPPVYTHVVGFGPLVDADALNAVATAGGTALPGTTAYHEANDASGLATALDTVIGGSAHCTLSVQGELQDPDDVQVWIDDQSIARDDTGANGWRYDADNQWMTFHGTACDTLRTAGLDHLTVVAACPPE